MTQLTITPSDPGQVTGFLVCYGNDGEVEEGVDIYLKLTKPPTGSGLALDKEPRHGTSDVDGLVEFTGLFKGARYLLWRGTDDANPLTVLIATNATDPVDLSNVAGLP
jgi:hypothetical protein